MTRQVVSHPNDFPLGVMLAFAPLSILFLWKAGQGVWRATKDAA
jgi:hypothetical protein